MSLGIGITTEAERKAERLTNEQHGYWKKAEPLTYAGIAMFFSVSVLLMFGFFAGLEMDSEYYIPFSISVFVHTAIVGYFVHRQSLKWSICYRKLTDRFATEDHSE